jgi:hypothetical protein
MYLRKKGCTFLGIPKISRNKKNCKIFLLATSIEPGTLTLADESYSHYWNRSLLRYVARQLFLNFPGFEPRTRLYNPVFHGQHTLSGVVMRWATWSLAGAPRPVRRWIEQVNTLRVPATPSPHTPRAAGQLEGGGSSGASLRTYKCMPFVCSFHTRSANRKWVCCSSGWYWRYSDPPHRI